MLCFVSSVELSYPITKGVVMIFRFKKETFHVWHGINRFCVWVWALQPSTKPENESWAWEVDRIETDKKNGCAYPDSHVNK